MIDSQFGFKQGDLDIIIQTLSAFPDVKRAVIFGSRAKDSYRVGSDVDIAVWAENEDIVWTVMSILNDLVMLPYKFDVLSYNGINNNDLKEHINRVGIEIYNLKTKLKV